MSGDDGLSHLTVPMMLSAGGTTLAATGASGWWWLVAAGSAAIVVGAVLIRLAHRFSRRSTGVDGV